MRDSKKLVGIWTVQVNDGPVEEFHNVIVNEGLDQMLGATFDSDVAKINTWYIGLYEGTVSPAVTWSSLGPPEIGARVLEVDDYDESTRQEWAEGDATDGTLAGSATAAFTFNATKTITGGFLSSASSKSGAGDASGVLFSCANFTNSKQVDSGDVLNIGYTVTVANT